MPTTQELDQMQDISGPALYSAELRRLPFLAPEEEARHIAAARAGDPDSRSALLSRCLPWLIAKAAALYVENRPAHSDVMDLVGQANVEIVAALPNALEASSPIQYLMSVGALAMKRYCFYDDPMVRRPRHRGDDYEHIVTHSLESGDWPLLESIAAPDMHLTAGEAEEYRIREQDQIVYSALQQLSPRYRDTLVSYYGLYGEPMRRIGDIAEELHIGKKAVDHILRRAKDKLLAHMTEQTSQHA